LPRVLWKKREKIEGESGTHTTTPKIGLQTKHENVIHLVKSTEEEEELILSI
jgi:hypothetical protein